MAPKYKREFDVLYVMLSEVKNPAQYPARFLAALERTVLNVSRFG